MFIRRPALGAPFARGVATRGWSPIATTADWWFDFSDWSTTATWGVSPARVLTITNKGYRGANAVCSGPLPYGYTFDAFPGQIVDAATSWVCRPASTLASGQPFTFIGVFRWPAATASIKYMVSGNNGGAEMGVDPGSTYIRLDKSGANISSVAGNVITGRPAVVTVYASTAGTGLALNGTRVTTGSDPAFNAGSPLESIGEKRFGTTLGFGDRVHEFLGWSRLLTISDVQKMEGYLAWKWGAQGLLDGGHPYKSRSPGSGFLSANGRTQPGSALSIAPVRGATSGVLPIAPGLSASAWRGPPMIT